MQYTGKVKLSEGKKLAVNLGFDFDAASVWMGAYGKTSPVYMSRGEFGAEVAVPRILDLLDDYGIKSTFCVPGHTADTHPDTVKEIIKRGHEICHHSYDHLDPSEQNYDEEIREIEKGFEALDKVGAKPVGYRSPGWDFSENTLSILEKYGFKYDSSLMGNDFHPYMIRPCTVNMERGNSFGEPSKIMELPVSWYLDDFPHSEFVMTRTGMKAPSQYYEIWKNHFDYGISHIKGGMMALTMHPQVTGRAHNIIVLERFIAYMAENGAEFLTLGQIADRTEMER